MAQMGYSKGMQKAIITLGAIIAVMSYAGFPRGFKEAFFLLAGIVVMFIGYKMRQEAMRLAYSTVEPEEDASMEHAPESAELEPNMADEVSSPTHTQ